MRGLTVVLAMAATLGLSGCETLGINDATDYVGGMFGGSYRAPAPKPAPAAQSAPPAVAAPAPVAAPPPPTMGDMTMGDMQKPTNQPATDAAGATQPPLLDADPAPKPGAVAGTKPQAPATALGPPPRNPSAQVPCRLKGEVRFVTAGFCYQMGGVAM